MSRAGSANLDAEHEAQPRAGAASICGPHSTRSSIPLLLAALGLTLVGVAVMADAWLDILSIAWVDEEASHIFLVPLVAAWLVWARQDELRTIRLGPSLIGPILIALGGLLNWYGFHNMTQSLFHGGAVLVAIGCFLTIAGHHILWRLLPAFVVLAFLVPVPGMVRQQIALPLQTATAASTEIIFNAFAVDIVRNGNVLRFNGVDVAVAEACNGMRMVFALVLVTYAVAFVSPLKAWVRVLVLALTPFFAIVCNVLRLLPTVWLYGYYPDTIAPIFHDLSGWVMIGVAWAMVTGLIALLRWLDIPVMQEVTSPADADLGRARAKVRGTGGALNVVIGGSALVLLGVVTAVAMARPAPADAEPYHARVRAVADALPRQMGDWTSVDAEVPQAAQQLLRPNAILSRFYTNAVNGRSATLVVVHCKDARDMVGHFPPACYPNSGWTQEDTVHKNWTVDGVTFTGTQYTFSFQHPTGIERMVVANLLVLPNGTLARDMDEVITVASDYTRRFFGAAQVQVLTSALISEAEREAIFDDIIGAALPLIQTIRGENADFNAQTHEPDLHSHT